MNSSPSGQIPDFFTAGGTLRADAPSYVSRRADDDLHGSLLRGEYCYVLTSRQMGKSSLMVRTASRLSDDGVSPVVLDLTAYGQNVTVEQWYESLILDVGARLDCEDEVEEFWQSNENLPPMRRWFGALREVVLKSTTAPVVVFVDEIDVVQSLPFSTNEFFAGIRECYTRRTQDEELARLTFCLLGVATPSDLIDDLRVTPFNIGHRVELADFAEEDAGRLVAGFEQDEGVSRCLLARILHWTGGHPYLTQRLCRSVAADASVSDDAGVDRLCEGLFFSESAREQDSNLQFARNQMLREDLDSGALLTMYRAVRAGKPVEHEETNPLVSALQLSGVVGSSGGNLRVRNRIYEHVFDVEWVRENMPDAEWRRQRDAVRRAMVKTVSVAVAVVIVVGALAALAFLQRQQARSESMKHRVALSRAQAQQGVRLLQEGNRLGLLELLRARESAEGVPAEATRRDLLWSAWYADTAGQLKTLMSHDGGVFAIAFSPDGGMLLSAGADGFARLWDAQSGLPLSPPLDTGGTSSAVAYSPTGDFIAAGNREIQVWNARTGKPHGALLAHGGRVLDMDFSPDGRLLATASDAGDARLWTVDSGVPWGEPILHGGPVVSVAFSPDGTLVVTASADGTARIATVGDLSRVTILRCQDIVGGAVFSPDGSLVITQSASTVRVWDAATGLLTVPKLTHRVTVRAIALHPAGKLLATTDMGAIVLWDATTGEQLGKPIDNPHHVYSLAFSPNGRVLAARTEAGLVHAYDVDSREEIGSPIRQVGFPTSMQFSPNSEALAVGTFGGTIAIWGLSDPDPVAEIVADVETASRATLAPGGKHVAVISGDLQSVYVVDMQTGRLVYPPLTQSAAALDIAFSPDGKRLATACLDGYVRVWETSTGTELLPPIAVAGRATSVCFHPDGRQIAVARADASRGAYATQLTASALVFDLASGTARAERRLHRGWIQTMAFSPNGTRLATGAIDKTARIWDLTSDAEPITLEHQDWVNCVAFSPDGGVVASGAGDGTVYLWDSVTGAAIGAPITHTTVVTTVAFSPDGYTLATGTRDLDLYLWETGSGTLLGPPLRHGGSVREVAFSTDGKSLVTVSYDGYVRRWALPRYVTDSQEMKSLTLFATGARPGPHGNAEPIPYAAWQEGRRYATDAAAKPGDQAPHRAVALTSPLPQDLYAATATGVRRLDGRALQKPGFTHPGIQSLASVGGGVLAGAPYHGLVRSTDSGSTWRLETVDHNVRSIDVGPHVVTLVDGLGVHTSHDGGVTWAAQPRSGGISTGALEHGDHLYTTTVGDGVLRLAPVGAVSGWLCAAVENTGPDTVAARVDWIERMAGITEQQLASREHAPQPGDTIGDSTRFPWRHVDSGGGMLNISQALDIEDAESMTAYLVAIVNAPDDRHVGMMVSGYDALVVWVNGEEVCRDRGTERGSNDPRFGISLRAGENVVLVKVTQGSGRWEITAQLEHHDDLLFSTPGGSPGVALSAEDAPGWVPVHGSLPNLHTSAIASWNGRLYVGTEGHGVFRLNEAENVWEQEAASGKFVGQFTATDEGLYVGSEDGGVARLSRNGAWDTINDGLVDHHITAMTSQGPMVYAATYSGQIYALDSEDEPWRPLLTSDEGHDAAP